MCYSLFGRGFQPRPRNCFPQPFCQPRNNMRQLNPQQVNNCPHSYTDLCCERYDECCEKYDKCCEKYDKCCKKYDERCNKCNECCNKCNDCCNKYHECCNKCCNDNILIKNAVFGGLVIPKGTEKRATFHVASLNLDTSGFHHFITELIFSSNIIADKSILRLRFQIFKQIQGEEFINPVSTGMLYYRENQCSESNSFTLSVCDRNFTNSTCLSYRIVVNIEDFETEGNVIIANPSLIATVIKYE